MLQQSTRFIERISSIPAMVVLTLVSVLFPTLLFPTYGIGNIKLLDLHFSYSTDQVYEHLAALGEEGRSAYTRMALTADLVFPVVYSLALSIALMLVLEKLFPPTNRFRHLCMFPFLVVIADWCENLSLAFSSHTFPDLVDWVVNFASFFTSLKWTLFVLTVLILLTSVIVRTVNGIRGK